MIKAQSSDIEKADMLLLDWHEWSANYRPNLGAPRISSYCRDSRSSRQYEDSSVASDAWIHESEMQAIAYCVYALSVMQQCAIGIEMRNRRGNAKVWQARPGAFTPTVTYDEALNAILPIMRKRGLFD